jgi:hypothetical protein
MQRVFLNNPYIAGFAPSVGLPLWDRARGFGHLIQRLQQGFDLPVDDVPRPEIYLSDDEFAWARCKRAAWPAERPACIFSPRVLTDGGQFRRVDWLAVGAALSGRFTLIQPVLTTAESYRRDLDPRQGGDDRWTNEPIVPGAIIYRDLPLRHYLSLFAVADAFCGGTSGGAHAAAAFDVPSLLVTWRDLERSLSFPVSSARVGPAWFVYPQHRTLAAEVLEVDQVDLGLLGERVDALAEQSAARRAGRPFLDLSRCVPVRPRALSRCVRAGRRGRIAGVRFRIAC